MNALETLKTWPGIEKANAETLLASPAWCLATEYAGRPAMIRPGTLPGSAIDLDIALDGEAHRLRIADSEAFPDLHLLWNRRAEMPPELLLSLVEKECGALLQTVENCARKQLSVRGLGDAASRDTLSAVLTADGRAISFAIELSPALAIEWGRVENIDVSHPSVRGLERPVRVEYATYDLTEAELGSLVPGGMLLLPEDALASWRLPARSDDLVHVVSAEESKVSFAQMVDDNWPDVPPPGAAGVLVVCKGRELARGTVVDFALQRAVRIA